jgi:ethanolamine-phosphate cytidylyltransferase
MAMRVFEYVWKEIAKLSQEDDENLNEKVFLCTAAAVLTLLMYYVWFGKSHSQRRKVLEKKLSQAQKTVRELEDKINSLDLSNIDTITKTGKEVRIFMDGAFDMMHYGHMNAFRQGKALGTTLVCGVNCDETITQCKGKPVNNEEERLAIIR